MSKALKDKIIIVNNFCFVFVYILMLSFRANKRVRYRFIPCFYLEAFFFCPLNVMLTCDPECW